MRFLVIEDNAIDFKLVEQFLLKDADLGAVIVHAVSLENALGALRRDNFDVVLTDLGLTDSWGMETYQRIRTAAPQLPMVVMSHEEDETVALEALKAGAQDYLLKSEMSKRALARSVHYALERKKHEEELSKYNHELEYLVEKRTETLRRANARLERDAQERKDTEKVLLNTYKTLLEERNLFYTGDVVVFRWRNSPKWPVEYVSPNVAEVLGYQAAEMISGELLYGDIIVAEDYERITAELDLAIATGNNFNCSYRIIHKDGSVRWVSESTIPVRGNDNQVTHFLGYLQDLTARRDAEERLKLSEERYRVLGEFNYDWEFWLGPDKKFIYVSPSCEKLTGYSRQEFIENPELAHWIVHPDDLERYEAEEAKAFNGQFNPQGVDFRIITRDNQLRWLNNCFRPVYLDTRFMGWRGSNRDITDRKQAEAELLLTRERLELAVRGSNDGLWDCPDRHLGHLWWSDHAYEQLGFQPGQVAPSVPFFLSLCHPDDQHRWDAFVDGPLEGGESFDIEARVKHAVDGYRWFRVRGQCMKNKDGSFRLAGSIQDVDDKKQAELRMKHLETVFDNANFGAAIATASGEIVTVNNYFARIHGYAPEELIGKGFLILHPPDKAAEVELLHQRLLAEGGFNAMEVPHIDRDGKTFPMLMSAIVIAGLGGAPSFIAVTAIDISNLKKAQEEAASRQRQLVQADKMTTLGILVSGVAHEINNPTNFIMVNIAILKRFFEAAAPLLLKRLREDGSDPFAGFPLAKLEPSLKKLLDGIDTGAERIRDIVNNLKDYARQGPGKSGSFDLNDTLKSALTLLGSLLRKSNARLEVVCAPKLPSLVGDKNRVEQVLINIIQNACQALTDKGQSIRIATRLDPERGEVVAEIADDGPGMDAETLKHIFDPFYTTKRDSGGTGLGLAISQSIVKEHGGWLEARSVPGQGATFTLRLPVPAAVPALREQPTLNA